MTIEKPNVIRTIPLKQWVHEEAGRLNLKPSGFRDRLRRGAEHWPKLIRKNKRVISVQVEAK